MNFAKTIRIAIAVSACAHFAPALAQQSDAACPSTPDAAALLFTRLGVTNARATVPLIRKASLRKYRMRLEQVVDERFSPSSSSFRDRLLGREWTSEKLQASSDEEVVAQFLAGGESARRNWTISEETVVERKKSFDGGIHVSVSYRIETPKGSTTQRREYAVYQSGDCYQVDIPVSAWAQLLQTSEELKKSRGSNLSPRQGESRILLEVAQGSFSPSREMRKLPRREFHDSVWVANRPILNANDVVGAEAAWDCEAGLGPEEPAVRLEFSDEGAKRLRDWTAGHIGSMLAVVVDDKILTFARVGATVGSRLTVCFPGGSLEKAQEFVKNLLGVAK